MFLAKVTPSRIKDRVVLYFEPSLVIPLHIDDYVKLHLKSNLEISDQDFQVILETSLRYLLRSYLLRQVAMSAKTKTLLQQKMNLKLRQLLLKYKFPQKLIDGQSLIRQQLQLAQDQGYIDNQQFVNSYIRRHPQYSKTMLLRALKAQGIDPSGLDFSHLETQDDSQKIKAYLSKKKLSKADFLDLKTKTKIIASLARKGFTVGQVKSAIDEYLQNR